MENFTIDYKTCSKCGTFAEVCPFLAIEKNSGDLSFKRDFIHLMHWLWTMYGSLINKINLF